MDFLHRLRASLAHFMYGRYGSDQLGRALLYASILLLFLAYPTGIGLFFILSIAGYGWVLFRIFSRDHEKRALENALYLQKTARLRTEVRQARVRFRTRKQFKYFRCPSCHARLRLTRGCGEKTVICRNCSHTFKMKA